MKTQLLSARDEAILRAIYKYRYVTAREITKLLFSDGAHKHVLGILPILAGGGDLQTNSYLCRFCLPSASAGNRERIYTLGVKGRDFLAKEIGLPVNWYFRPYKLKHFSYSTILHNLILSRFVVAAQICKEAKVKEVQLSYELANAPGKVKLDIDVQKKIREPLG